MCGICGIVSDLPDKATIVSRMMVKMKHRGPDDEGIFDSKFCSLGNTRLAIIDVDNGKLPIYNESRNLVLAFNGEIYNYLELKNNLIQLGHSFKTESDSEVLLYMYEEYGVECLSYLNGMFAFAIWNNKKKELFFARDRLGIKPFYYNLSNNHFVFASELKTLLESWLIKKEVNPLSIYIYLMSKGFAPPETIIKDIKALESGSYGIYKEKKIIIKKYWALKKNIIENSYKNTIDELEFLLVDSISKRLQSDVPMGVFLSGGIDSGMIAAMSSKKKRIKTFSIGFESKYKAIDELSEAKLVSDMLVTEHYETKITEDDFNEDFDKIIKTMDQPSGDVFNSWFVSKFASQRVKVALSGTGGDELFFGYPHFGKIYEYILNSGDDVYSAFASRLRYFTPADGANIILNKYFTEYYGVYKDYWKRAIEDYLQDSVSTQLIKTVQHHYLNSVFLKDIDTMSMAHSLEVRTPFLDHRLVEFAFNLKFNLLYRKEIGYKIILKDLFKSYFPSPMLPLKKKGFELPFEAFFKTSRMEEVIRDILSRNKVEKTGVLYYKMIDKIVDGFYSDGSFGPAQLLAILPLQAWMNNNI